MLVKTTPFKIRIVAGVISSQIVDVPERCKKIGSEKKINRLMRDTGFKKLSIAKEGVCASDMCIEAANHILKNYDIELSSIGGLIFVTQSPDYPAPSTAFVMQKKLGLSPDIVAFDINMGCSGFVIGLYLAGSLISSMPDKKILLCCGDVASNAMDSTSAGKVAITGDAGSCALIEKDSITHESVWFNIESYGNRFDSLFSINGRARHPFTYVDGKLNVDDKDNFPVMNGIDVLNFTMNEVAQNIEKILDHLKIGKQEIDSYLFHQPNLILLRALQDELNIPWEKIIYNSQFIGNTSSASIPLLLTEIGTAWSNRPRGLSLLSGFGIGLSVGSVVLDLSDTVCVNTLKM